MVERYSMIGRDFGARMDVSSNGAWVRYCDLAAARAEIERLRAAIDAWRTAFWVMDGHAVAIHDAEGKCYSVRAHDYIVMHDLHRAALAQEGLTND